MSDEREKKIQAEIRRRALEQANLLEHESQNELHTQATLDALQEVTGLPADELEKIASDVRASYPQGKKDIFSIKNQILLVILFGLILSGVLILAVWLF